MFLENKYTKWYYNIINNACQQKRVKSKSFYFENHHIIPRSLGGNNTKNNTVLLTAREHYICHWLLLKMVFIAKHKKSMWFAFRRMTHSPTKHNKRYISKMYAKTKELFSVAPNKNYKHTEETKKILSIKLSGRSHTEETKKIISLKLKGRKPSEIALKNMSLSHLGQNKGKTYEEIYGNEKAKKIRKSRSNTTKKVRSEKFWTSENKEELTIKNNKTQEIFVGTRSSIRKYTGMTYGDMSALLGSTQNNKRCVIKGWGIWNNTQKIFSCDIERKKGYSISRKIITPQTE